MPTERRPDSWDGKSVSGRTSLLMSVAEATNPDALHQSGDFVACNDRRALHVGIGETLFQSAMDLARLGQRCGVAMSW